jgi:hypothetical protein
LFGTALADGGVVVCAQTQPVAMPKQATHIIESTRLNVNPRPLLVADLI